MHKHLTIMCMYQTEPSRKRLIWKLLSFYMYFISRSNDLSNNHFVIIVIYNPFLKFDHTRCAINYFF